jgi:hypothetical protein
MGEICPIGLSFVFARKGLLCRITHGTRNEISSSKESRKDSQRWSSIKKLRKASMVRERFHDLFCKERIFSTVPTWFSLAPGIVSTHGTLQHRTHQRNGTLIAVHSNDLIGHHWSCEKMLSAFPLKAGKTANMLLASRSTFMLACVPSADKTLHSADTAQRRLSAGHRRLCPPDHRKLRTGRTHQRKDYRRLGRWGNPAA